MMNINSIQSGQLSQNAIRSNDRSGQVADGRSDSSYTQSSVEMKTPHVSAEGVILGINYFKDQIREILTSFPPFFPAGSPQRINLIKKIKGLEELAERSSPKKSGDNTSSDNRLSEDASDQEISAALDRLFGFRDAVQQANPQPAEPPKSGTIVSVKV
jgi:hypothetical protein